MTEPLGIALVGCGTVGGGVARLLIEQSDRLTQRGGRPLALRHVIVRDLDKPRPIELQRGLVSTDYRTALRDPAVDVVVELIGGTDLARSVVLDSLSSGKHVVTANKALLAIHGPEVFEAARSSGRAVCFEAAVAGGIPIIRALAESLSANQVTAIQGILNGTSNFILSRMTDRGTSYSEALAEAQRLGFAEADPTLDVDGSDAAHKLAILAQIAFGVVASPRDIDRQGIDLVDALDVRFARDLGYTIKLLAEAWADGRQVALHVAPVLLRHTDMLAQVRGSQNAVQVVGDVVGETLYQGPGAGALPTASAVLADLIDLAVGRAQRTFAASKLWSREGRGYTVEPAERVRSRFYMRLMVEDRPGTLADVGRVLGEQEISVASLIQHESPEGQPGQSVPIVLMTHTAETGKFRAAVAGLNRLPCVTAPVVHYSVDD